MVFELPMRDGNFLLIFYLQHYHLVFELPMRDGNNKDSITTLNIVIPVFELPMRDGNNYDGYFYATRVYSF